MKTIATFATALFMGATGPAMAQTHQMPMKASGPVAVMPLIDGEVRKLDQAAGLIVLRHGEIPNLAMPAMTMGFDVADKKMLDGLKVGDKVRFQAEMIKGKSTVTELRPLK